MKDYKDYWTKLIKSYKKPKHYLRKEQVSFLRMLKPRKSRSKS